MTDIFISYRIDDTQGWAGRIEQALRASFPRAQVFHDIATIRPGEEFASAIDRALSSCRVLLALIGPRWLSVQNPDGRRRLDDPEDFVRSEIAAALARSILVVPVLVGGVAPPKAASLPEVLQPLARRQCHELTDKRWDYDLGHLLPVLGESLGMTLRPVGGGDKEVSVPVISVGEGLTIVGARVGDIAGMKVAGDSNVTAPGRIEVAHGARIENAEVGDIVGVKSEKQD